MSFYSKDPKFDSLLRTIGNFHDLFLSSFGVKDKSLIALEGIYEKIGIHKSDAIMSKIYHKFSTMCNLYKNYRVLQKEEAKKELQQKIKDMIIWLLLCHIALDEQNTD